MSKGGPGNGQYSVPLRIVRRHTGWVGNSSVKSVPLGKAAVNQQELRIKSAPNASFQSPFFEDYKYRRNHHGEAQEIVPAELFLQIQHGKN